MLPILQAGIARAGLTSRVYRDAVPETCAYRLEYVAYRRWDFTAFLSDADVVLYRGNERVGSFKYKTPSGIFGGGGANPEKWQSTGEKLDPLMDAMLQHVRQQR